MSVFSCDKLSTQWDGGWRKQMGPMLLLVDPSRPRYRTFLWLARAGLVFSLPWFLDPRWTCGVALAFGLFVGMCTPAGYNDEKGEFHRYPRADTAKVLPILLGLCWLQLAAPIEWIVWQRGILAVATYLFATLSLEGRGPGIHTSRPEWYRERKRWWMEG